MTPEEEKKIKDFVDVYWAAIEKHRYFPGNYESTCTYCKKIIRWCDKMCFICSDCMDEKLKQTV